MGQVVSMLNQKGGVGKTTTSVNLATALALRGYKVLVLDMDPQGNASSALGVDLKKPTIYQCLCKQIPLSEAVQPSELENLFFIPSNAHLSALEVEILSEPSWEYRLKSTLQPYIKDYKYIFIDCPPSLGPLTVNVLVASESFIIPLQCEYYALEGLSQLKETVRRIRENFNPRLELKGILLTMFDQRNSLSHQIEAEVRKHFNKKVFQTVIPRNIRLSEAPGFGKSIFQYDPRSAGAKQYFNLSAEFSGTEVETVQVSQQMESFS